jgi:hypothetical protein
MVSLLQSPIARAVLGRCRVSRGGPRDEGETLAGLLRARGYEPHDAARAFEGRYGGFEVREGDEEAPALVIGVYACLCSGFSSWPRGGEANVSEQLVPAILAWDDMIYYVGAGGRGWAEWLDDSAARPIARDGEQLVTQALLWRVLSVAGVTWHPGEDGADLARQRGLAPIAEASSDTEQWWGDAAALLVQTLTEHGPKIYDADCSAWG